MRKTGKVQKIPFKLLVLNRRERKTWGVWRTQADTEGKRQRGRGTEQVHLMVDLLLGMHMPPGLDSPAQQKKTKKGKKSEKLL